MSFDFLLNPETGDLEWDTESNDLILVKTEGESLRQRLGIRLRTNRGEWVFNQIYGIPYTNQIIGQKVTKREVDTIIQAEALNEDGVDFLLDFQSNRDVYTRQYSTAFKVVSNNEVLPIFLPNQINQEWEYPEPDPTNLLIDCNLENLLLYANLLYKHINFDLPFTGESTWWDVTGFFTESSTLFDIVNFRITANGDIRWTSDGAEFIEQSGEVYSIVNFGISSGGTIPWEFGG